MDPLTFDYGDLHLRVDRGVFEIFNLSTAERTFRVPLRWLGVLVHYKKPYFTQVATLADRRVA
ncbi:hypothetical protein ACIGXA_23405 [Streptomyces fildesensis]|uniref:KTSC domain-containing protein n=1 Tax=Streptomyces fildesensis TaxID=375757 RepID=A0ABW8CBL6_9ACTN